MSDADWDKEGFKPPTVVVGRSDRWEGEDEEEDIKDNWDDDDDEEAKSESNDQPKAPSKKKKNLAVIIAEKEEKRRRELEEKKRLLEEEANVSKPKTQEELLQERLEAQKLQEESDLLLAKEVFGVSESKPEGSLDVALSSKEDFDIFKKNLVTKLQAVEKSPHYVPFLETAFREICVTLEADDIKRISSNLSALFNEKIKAQKLATKGKKNKPKSTLKIERSAMDLAADDYVDEFDEFI